MLGGSKGTSGVIVVVAALIARDGRLLICQRRKNDTFALKWEFPGGKVKPGESPERALTRELHEELGAGATVGPLVYSTRHRYPEYGSEIELLFYSASLDEPEVQNLAFEKVSWEAPAALPTYDFLPADRELIERLARGDVEFA